MNEEICPRCGSETTPLSWFETKEGKPRTTPTQRVCRDCMTLCPFDSNWYYNNCSVCEERIRKVNKQ